jgi:hypothetical protein
LTLASHINRCIRARAEEVTDFSRFHALLEENCFIGNTNRPEPGLLMIPERIFIWENK